MNILEFTYTMNDWGHQQIPFLFMVDFEMEKPLIIKLDEIREDKILFDLNGFTNVRPGMHFSQSPPAAFDKFPLSLKDYKEKFDVVFHRLLYGDSYLTNLTVKTEIHFKNTLRDLFFQSKARYKLWFDDQFLVFSPEIFVQIKDGIIFSNPMKGTIDARIPHAKEILLKDKKELAEHVTIVDLIRNDLSQIAHTVEVIRFRYLDEIKTNEKTLLQMSSEITGILTEKYVSKLGDCIVALLPAGSVSGAPKAKTMNIIQQAEQEKRGYYTGIFGYFDGKKLDSGVMIRYIEKKHDRYFFRSGGGITTQSLVGSEYQEMIDKVYVPID